MGKVFKEGVFMAKKTLSLELKKSLTTMVGNSFKDMFDDKID